MYNLEKLQNFENSPIHISRKEYITQKYGNMWKIRLSDSDYKSETSDYYWFKLDKVLKRFIGKSVDKAYSAYCKLVKFYEKEYFWDAFGVKPGYVADYKIDKNRNIQSVVKKRFKKNKPVIFRSFDYATGYYDTKTKKVVDSVRNLYLYPPSRFIEVVTSGYVKIFEFKKDPEYIRLMSEFKKQRKLWDKQLKKLKKQKQYSFLSEKEKLRKITELDTQKLQSHGFNDESFKGEEYHGQKRKRKKKKSTDLSVK